MGKAFEQILTDKDREKKLVSEHLGGNCYSPIFSSVKSMLNHLFFFVYFFFSKVHDHIPDKAA